jgi:nicotinamide-nucleotide amidase
MNNTLEAWILTIGNEIINAVISDTNREAIARELLSKGIAVRGMSSVPDEPQDIADALETAMRHAPVTVVSGGLGPTEDDKTAASVAAWLKAPLELDGVQLGRIEDRFRKWNRPMASANIKQAMLPKGSTAIPNDYGTAPGFMIEKDGRIALFMPGVPSELKRMLREQGIPLILNKFGQSSRYFATTMLHVYGYSESKLQEVLEDLARDEDGYHLAFLPRFPIIRLKIDVQAGDESTANERLAQKKNAVVERLRENILSDDGKHMEELIVSMLLERGKTLTLAESITGGMMGEWLTRVAGSSDVFMGSIVSYSNDLKMDVLGVPAETISEHGAVSHECAREMAVGAKRVGKSDFGLSITGIAGPGGGSDLKPVGTFYVGLATPDEVITRGFLLPGTREWIRTLGAMQSFDLLRRYLSGYRIHGAEQ